MVELDEQLRQDLARLRDRQGPSPDAQQRMLATLESTLAGPSGPDGSGGDASGAPPDLVGATSTAKVAFAAKVVAATAAMTGAGLLALRLAVVGVRAMSPSPAPEHVSERAPEPTRPKPSPPAVDEVDPEPFESEAASASEPLDRPKPRRRADAKSSEASDPLAIELGLLEVARSAEPSAALATLERHRDRFPHGQLAAEREVMRVEVLCQLGRIDDAREVAERFLATRPNSPLRPSVRAACPALGLDAKK